MKRFMCILISIISCIILIACKNSSDHTGEAKTPSGSSVMNGRNYQSVVEEFEENGFTNIKLEKMEDLIIGWLKEDGEVEDVSVGGDFDYSPDKWVPNDTEVIIRYHTFPEEEEEETNQPKQESDENNDSNTIKDDSLDEILTIDNCEELNSILSIKADIDESYLNFADKYKGRTIEFDASIDHLMNHDDYDTRYDILLTSGDFDPNHVTGGPMFKFENVNASDLGLDTLYLTSEIKVGQNVKVIAKVVEFDSKSYLFFLDPIAVKSR